MKDQVEIKPGLPLHWQSVPLRDLCSSHNGLWKGKKEPFETANVIRNTNFTADGRIDLSDVAVLEVEAKQLTKRRLRKNDIIIEKSGGGPKQPVGRVVLFELDDGIYSFSNFTSAIRVEDAQRLDAVYLHRVLYSWYLSGRTEPLQRRSTGIRNLDFNAYKEIEVPLPPLEEQKRIVAVLDQAFAAIDRARAHAEANLADAVELLQNGVNDVFTGLGQDNQATPLSEAVHPCCKLSYGIVQPGDSIDNGLPVVRPVDLRQRVVTLKGLKRIGPERAAGYARTKLVGGELLLCVRGSTGELSVASPELAGANVTRGIVPIRFPTDEVLPEFAYFQLRSRYVQDQIAAGTYGAALMQINIKDLRNLRFIVPEIGVQREIVDRVEHLYAGTERLCATYAAKLADIDNLRHSLLRDAFSGKIT